MNVYTKQDYLIIDFTLICILRLPFSTAIRFVSLSVPESTIHTFAEVVVPLFVGTTMIRYVITAKNVRICFKKQLIFRNYYLPVVG